MRYLTWHIKGSLIEEAGRSQVRETYVLDQDYLPVEITLYIKTAPTLSDLVIDINDDEVSIFTQNPRLSAGQKQTDTRSFSPNGAQRILSGSFITLDIDSVGSGEAGRDLTVILTLKELGNPV